MRIAINRPSLTLLLAIGVSLAAASTAVAKPGDSQSFGEKDWNAVNDMTSLNGKIYVAAAVNILEVDGRGNAKPVPIKGEWGRTYNITVLDGSLYCISEETLFQVDPSGRIKDLGKEWYSVPGMAALDGKLYIISSEDLFEVDKETGKYTKLTSDWFKVDGMATLAGKLYILSRDRIYEVDKSGNRKEIGAPIFNSPNAMTAADGKLYVFAFERQDPGKGGLINEATLYEIDTDGKTQKVALPKGWDKGTGLSAMTALDGKLFMSMPGMRSRLFSLDLK